MLVDLYPNVILLPNNIGLCPAAARRLIGKEFMWDEVFLIHYYSTYYQSVPKPWKACINTHSHKWLQFIFLKNSFLLLFFLKKKRCNGP